MTIELIQEILRRVEAIRRNERDAALEIKADGSWRILTNLKGDADQGVAHEGDSLSALSDLMTELRGK